MRYQRSFLVLSLVLVASIAFAAPALARSGAMAGCNPAAAVRVVVATNRYRESLGLSQLTVEPRLSVFAVVHANDMAVNAILTHSSSGGESFAAVAPGKSGCYASMELGSPLR